MERRHIAIASSSKFYDRVRSAVETFQSHGLTCHTPAFDFDETKVVVGREQKYQLTWIFLEKVKASDVLYVIDTDGYTGTSVCLEVGYAYALGKPVYAIEPPSEPAVASLVTAVVGVDELAKSLRGRVEI
jgi:nucleoside 2-deoxyribosyltransferase